MSLEFFNPEMFYGNPHGVGSYGGRPAIGQAQVPSNLGFFPNNLGGYYSIGAADTSQVEEADRILKSMSGLSNAQKNIAFAKAASILNSVAQGNQALPMIVTQNYNDLSVRQKALLADTISSQIDFEAVDDERKSSGSNAESIAEEAKELKDSIADAKMELRNDWKIDPNVVQSVIDGTINGSNAVHYYIGGAVLLGVVGLAYMMRRK